MYDIFERLLNERGVTAYRVARNESDHSHYLQLEEGELYSKQDKFRKNSGVILELQ